MSDKEIVTHYEHLFRAVANILKDELEAGNTSAYEIATQAVQLLEIFQDDVNRIRRALERIANAQERAARGRYEKD